ncbi:MAG TPA: galactokinase family protein [Gemmatimonadaceae bacterium]|nr:galactokinase family protein [Gemmatimonadaceae bacterium]
MPVASHIAELEARGMSASSARVAGPAFAQCDATLTAVGASSDRWSIWVPGRIELFGKHTDYGGGRSLLTAVERGFTARAARRTDGVVRVLDVTRNEQCEAVMGIGGPTRQGEWSNYVATTARRIGRDFPALRRGADIALASGLPSAAGLSSSSALIVTVALALIRANGFTDSEQYAALFPDNETLAAYFGAVESGAPFGRLSADAGVGTLGGSEDHIAILACEPRCVSDYRFSPPRREGRYEISPAFTFVIGASGVTAHKTGAAQDRYNRVSLLLRHALDAWNTTRGESHTTMASVIDTVPGAATALAHVVAEAATPAFTAQALKDRVQHFVSESYRIVPAAADHLRRGAIAELGGLADESQRLAETLLGNQTVETVSLQRLARQAGAVAASAFGAGFGGSVWAVVETDRAAEFAVTWERLYRSAHPLRAGRSRFFTTDAGPHAAMW